MARPVQQAGYYRTIANLVEEIRVILSAEGRLAIQHRECRAPNFTPDLVAYRDGNGPNSKWTIGCGHTGPEVHEGLTWTLEQGYAALDSDTSAAAAAINKLVTVPLKQNQFDALLSFVFNVGVGAFETSSALKVLNAGNYDDVPAHMMLYKYANGDYSKPSQGVLNRRISESGQWNQGAFVASATVEATQAPVVQVAIRKPSVWIKGAGLASVFSGSLINWIQGDQIVQAGHQLQDLATTGSNWHVFATIGGGLILLGIMWEFFHKKNNPS